MKTQGLQQGCVPPEGRAWKARQKQQREQDGRQWQGIYFLKSLSMLKLVKNNNENKTEDSGKVFIF